MSGARDTSDEPPADERPHWLDVDPERRERRRWRLFWGCSDPTGKIATIARSRVLPYVHRGR